MNTQKINTADCSETASKVVREMTTLDLVCEAALVRGFTDTTNGATPLAPAAGKRVQALVSELARRYKQSWISTGEAVNHQA